MTDSFRKAQGSDIWAITWASDGALYGIWGDGSGFHGDPSGGPWKASLGVSRILGTPVVGNSNSVRGEDVWAAPGYAQHAATFGGKVGSVVSIDGVLYAYGHLWTKDNTPDQKEPTRKYEAGPLYTLIWSKDLGQSWQIAPWSNDDSGTFLQFGQDNREAIDDYVYSYYKRPTDNTHVYLKRVHRQQLLQDPHTSGAYEYLHATYLFGSHASWSKHETEAIAVFSDASVSLCDAIFDKPLGRFIIVTGHNATGLEKDDAAGSIGVFEGRHPWGPWRTIGYYSDLGHLDPIESHGDFLGLRFPMKWISADGKTLWAVFSSMGRYDSLNLARAKLNTPD